MRTLWLALLCLILPPSLLFAGDEIIEQRIVDLSREENRVLEYLDYLVNRIGPRLTGSHNDHVACEWARDTMQEIGLEGITMEKSGEFPVAFNRGPWSGKMISPVEKTLEFGTPAWSAGTKGAVQAPVVWGPDDVDTADPQHFAGKWVLMERQQRRGNRDARAKQRAQRQFLESAEVAGFVYPTRGKYIITGGNPRIQWDDLPKIPRINLLKDHWDEIRERVDAGEKVILQFDIRNYFAKGPTPYYTVWGDIVGAEFPDEYVIIGGHIDSWDGATGTTDDGMGVAVMLEAARLLKKAGATPRRTIRFMTWSGEEQGLLASRGYVDAHPELLDKISGAFVYDGGPNAVAGIMATPQMMEDFEQAFAPLLDLNPDLPFQIKEVKGLPSQPGSDHLSFLRKDVPGFFWTQEGRADWRHGIHTQFDTFDLAIPEYLEHSALVVSLAALGIANLDGLLSREELRAPGGGRGRRMGVFLDDLTANEVMPDSVAEKAGLKAGDVIEKVDGEKVSDRGELFRAIRDGETRKTVTVKRDGRPVDLVFEWPAEPEQEPKAEKKRVVF